MTDHQTVLNSYLHRRAVAIRLSNLLVQSLSAKTLRHAASELNMMIDDAIVIDSEMVQDILMDFAIHSCRINGRSTARLFYDTQGPHDHEDREVLQSMTRGYYSFFRVLETERALGLWAWDILQDKQVYIVDIGLGTSVSRNSILASRVFPFDDYLITGGASLPISMGMMETIIKHLVSVYGSEFNPLSITPAQEKELAKTTIRTFFESPDRVEVVFKSFVRSSKTSRESSSKNKFSFLNLFQKKDREKNSVANEGLGGFDDEPTLQSDEPVHVVVEQSSERSERSERSKRFSGRCPCGSRKKYSACCGRR